MLVLAGVTDDDVSTITLHWISSAATGVVLDLSVPQLVRHAH